MSKRLVSYRHTFINSIGTFFSRLTGMIKLTVVNHLFGAKADPFFIVFKMINSLRKIIGEGALSNAFIPVFQKENAKDSEKASLFASNIINIFLLGATIFTVIAILLAQYYFPYIALGYERGSDNLRAGIILLMIMLPFTIFISLFAMGMGILNSNKRFTTPAFAPLLFNISFILFPVLLHKQLGIYSVAIGVVVGSILMFLLEIIELIQIGFKYKLYINFKDPALKSFIKLFLPTSLNMSLLILTSLFFVQFATFLPDGNITILYNSQVINQAPIGIFGIAIATVLLPLLSKIAADKDDGKFAKALNEGFGLLIYLIAPITLFFIIYPDVIINLIYRDLMLMFTGNTGRFTKEIFEGTTKATSIYASGIFAMAANIIFAKIFYSRTDAKTPLYANIILIIISLAGYILSKTMSFGYKGFAIADVSAAWGVSFYYLMRLKKFIDMKTAFKGSFVKLIKISAISIVILLSIYPLYNYIYINASNAYISFLYGTLSIMIFGGAYYFITKILKLGLKR